MSGVAVIRSLLASNASVLSRVPATRIMAGTIPLGTLLPAISITQVSSNPRLTIGMDNSQKILTAERVQVTVMTKTYVSQKTILDLVRLACPNSSGLINGVSVDSILPDIASPDFFDSDTQVFMQSRDFIVKFLE